MTYSFARPRAVMMFVVWLAMFWTGTSVFALSVPEKKGFVRDMAGMLSAGAAKGLEEIIAAQPEQGAAQVWVLTVPRLDGQDIRRFAQHVSSQWGIGLDKTPGSVLLLIARDDQKLCIDTGFAVMDANEGRIADHVLQTVIVPRFSVGEFERGVFEGADALGKKFAGSASGPPLAFSSSGVPVLHGMVNDYAQMLSAQTVGILRREVKNLEESDSTQIVVLTLPSLGGRNLEEYTLQIAQEWGLGHKGKDNGALLFLARDERKIRIEVGYGLEGVLTDLVCGRIIRNTIVPALKAGNPDQGVLDGVRAMIAVTRGEHTAATEVASLFSLKGYYAQHGLVKTVKMGLLFALFALFLLCVSSALLNGILLGGLFMSTGIDLLPGIAVTSPFLLGLEGLVLGFVLTRIVKFFLPIDLTLTDIGMSMLSSSSSSSWSSSGSGSFGGGGGSFGGGGASGGW